MRMHEDDPAAVSAERPRQSTDPPKSPLELDELAALRDRLLRALADAENARRRAEVARSEGQQAGVADLASRLIGGLDSLDLALRAEPGPGQEASAFAAAVLEGVRSARRELLDGLQKTGVERVDPAGETFDPSAHEAVATRPDRSAKPGQVLEVLQPGYRIANRLIRPARVIVAAPAAS